MKEGNGENRFWIEIKCEYAVYDEEWAAILFLVNDLLSKYASGKFSNVGAFLCEDERNTQD